MNGRAVRLIAGSVLRESVRRREIYVLVLVAYGLIGVILSLDFFGVGGLTKFYREASLKVMGWTTAFAVIVLAARQLPREIENRTIYPLLARPLRRVDFLFGKLLGVLLAGLFCFALFMAIFLLGSLRIQAAVPWGLFLQHIYLQIWMLAVVATLGFWLSLLVHTDAAITICVLLYALSAVSSMVLVNLYAFLGTMGRHLLLILTYMLPQLTLLDLSEKAVHAEVWPPLSWPVMLALSGYAAIYVLAYFTGALVAFRRRAL
ncbi:MAG: ABC transporter permease [Kiritimatiellia bacterium]